MSPTRSQAFPARVPHILKVAPDGTTTVLAGNGPDGFSGDGGPATLRRSQHAAGRGGGLGRQYVYVADYGNHRVRKIDTTGTINTIAGNGRQFSGDNGPATLLESIPSI
jgi:hypothetical protein